MLADFDDFLVILFTCEYIFWMSCLMLCISSYHIEQKIEKFQQDKLFEKDQLQLVQTLFKIDSIIN